MKAVPVFTLCICALLAGCGGDKFAGRYRGSLTESGTIHSVARTERQSDGSAEPIPGKSHVIDRKLDGSIVISKVNDRDYRIELDGCSLPLRSYDGMLALYATDFSDDQRICKRAHPEAHPSQIAVVAFAGTAGFAEEQLRISLSGEVRGGDSEPEGGLGFTFVGVREK